MSATDLEQIDGTAEEISTDLAPVETHQPSTLFRTDDPVEVIERASRAADALKTVLVRQGLTQNIQGKDYVKVEGWTTLGSMLGVVPVCTWTKELPDGWEARVEARTLDGRVIGAAEAQCTRSERMWKSRDPYALRSMAQTRATSKALRGPLGFIVTLAGYEATPVEEMPRDTPTPTSDAAPAPTTIGPTATKQLTDQYARYEAAGLTYERLEMQAAALGGELDTSGEGSIWKLLTREQGLALYEWMAAEIASTTEAAS